MGILLRTLAYAGVCSAAVGGSLAATLALIPIGVAVLPETSGPQPSARIVSWLEREAVAMPEAPRPHGPAFTPGELRALSARNLKAEPVVRIPIAAMTEDEGVSETGGVRRSGRARITVRPAPTIAEAASASGAFARTARERYAPERNY